MNDEVPHAAARDLLGDPAALASLRSRLLRFARRSLSEADAEDVTQETLLALLSTPDRYRGMASVDTYAHAVLRHKTIDVYRVHARESPHEPEALQAAIERAAELEFETEPANDPAASIDAQRQVQRFWITLRACLRELPQKMRVMFELREVCELELPAACRHLGVSCNHGGVLAHRARAHVRRRWSACAERGG